MNPPHLGALGAAVALEGSLHLVVVHDGRLNLITSVSGLRGAPERLKGSGGEGALPSCHALSEGAAEAGGVHHLEGGHGENDRGNRGLLK